MPFNPLLFCYFHTFPDVLLVIPAGAAGLPTVHDTQPHSSSCSQHASLSCLPQWKPDCFQGCHFPGGLFEMSVFCLCAHTHSPQEMVASSYLPLAIPGFSPAHAKTPSSHFSDSGIPSSSLPPNTLKVIHLRLLRNLEISSVPLPCAHHVYGNSRSSPT